MRSLPSRRNVLRGSTSAEYLLLFTPLLIIAAVLAQLGGHIAAKFAPTVDGSNWTAPPPAMARGSEVPFGSESSPSDGIKRTLPPLSGYVIRPGASTPSDTARIDAGRNQRALARLDRWVPRPLRRDLTRFMEFRATPRRVGDFKGMVRLERESDGTTRVSMKGELPNDLSAVLEGSGLLEGTRKPWHVLHGQVEFRAAAGQEGRLLELLVLPSRGSWSPAGSEPGRESRWTDVVSSVASVRVDHRVAGDAEAGRGRPVPGIDSQAVISTGSESRSPGARGSFVVAHMAGEAAAAGLVRVESESGEDEITRLEVTLDEALARSLGLAADRADAVTISFDRPSALGNLARFLEWRDLESLASLLKEAGGKAQLSARAETAGGTLLRGDLDDDAEAGGDAMVRFGTVATGEVSRRA